MQKTTLFTSTLIFLSLAPVSTEIKAQNILDIQPSASFTSSRQPVRPVTQDLCNNTSGYQSTYLCLADKVGRLTLAVQMFRYATNKDVRAETSIVKSVFDAWCAVGLVKSVDKHFSNVDNVLAIRNGKYQNQPNGAVKAAWEAYAPRKKELIEHKTWANDLAPDLVKIKVNESPLYWLQGPAKALAREKLTGAIDPDATMDDITSSICSRKIQNDWMGWGSKKSLFSAVTENYLWDSVVIADGKINKYGTYTDAVFKAKYDGKTAITTMLDEIKREVDVDMKEAVPADKIRAGNILGELKQIFVDATRNAPEALGKDNAEQGIRDFDQRMNNVINMGKHFDENSAIRQHTETLGYFLSEIRTQYRSILETSHKTQQPAPDLIDSSTDEAKHKRYLPHVVILPTINNNNDAIIVVPPKDQECERNEQTELDTKNGDTASINTEPCSSEEKRDTENDEKGKSILDKLRGLKPKKD